MWCPLAKEHGGQRGSSSAHGGVGGKVLWDPEGKGEAGRARLAEVGWEELRTPGFFSTGREWAGDGEQGGEVSAVTRTELRHSEFTPSSQKLLRQGTRFHVPGDRTEGGCKGQDTGDPVGEEGVSVLKMQLQGARVAEGLLLC